MKSYSSTDSHNPVHVLQLDQGDDLLGSILDFVEQSGLRTGAVVSGIGTLDRCTLHMVTTTGYPPVEVFPTWTDTPLELVGMQGAIADGKPHIHMTVSDRDQATGGHLEPGCRILYLAEVVIQEYSGLDLTRVENRHGIPMLTRRSGSA